MRGLISQTILLAATQLVAFASGTCYEPSPAFPVPSWKGNAQELQPSFAGIDKKLNQLIDDAKYENVSFSIEVTTNTETIWSHFHTALRQDKSRPGVETVDANSQYRIASISKVFTTLAILYQHSAGNLSLYKPIQDYVPELSDPDSGELPWFDIGLGSLLTQSSGIPRDSIQNDFMNWVSDPSKYGLPPMSRKDLPRCNEYNDYKPCSRSDFLNVLKTHLPLFAPNQFPSYSNDGFMLLGLAIENVTGLSYETYIQTSIFDPLNMTMSSLSTPSDDHAVLPADGNSWDVNESIGNPTGGIYSSASDMSKFLRFILSSYNTLSLGINWLKPATWSYGTNSFYGAPFEIFRTDRILPSTSRPVTFVTKSGGLEGYVSQVLILEEYGLGITILVGSSSTDALGRIVEAVTVELVRGAERAVWKDVGERYHGTYVAVAGEDGEVVDSVLKLAGSEEEGLVVEEFVSNGTDARETLAVHRPILGPRDGRRFRAQLTPTLLYKDEERRRGEVWRVVAVPEKGEGEDRAVWDDFCAVDIDGRLYAGLPMNEVVFWHEEGVVELPAWRVKLKLEREDRLMEGLIVQD